MAESGVYEIRNLASGKRYVGSAVNLESRRSNHFGKLSAGKHANVHLQRAHDRDGASSFAFRVLFSGVPPAILIRLEQAAMDVLKPEYNIEKRAGSSLGLRRGPMSTEHKEAIRRGLLGRIYSEETRQRMSLAAMGNKKGVGHTRHHTAETRAKMSASHKGKTTCLGRKASDETRLRLSESHKGHRPSDETRHKLSEAAKGQWKRWREAKEAHRGGQ